MEKKKIRDYVLIKFIENLKQTDESEAIDIVSKTWLRYNKKPIN